MPVADKGKVANLPAELTSFVGRRKELSDLVALLAGHRLVTVTGTGGAGKTRLAMRAAVAARRGFAGGVFFVDLTQLDNRGLPFGEIHDLDLLVCLVLAALGVRPDGTSPLRQLAGFLADRPAVLVLDNCEHLILACTRLADALLRRCPALRILATSREPLTISGEVLYPLPPLPTPGPDPHPDPARLIGCESVALFLARARGAVPGFAVTDGNAGAVAELCRRLDGLPLAIELAASRMRVLGPAQILDRLGLTLLARGGHAAPARQQTLRACVEWSFALCSEPERLLWARSSVFVGGFELEALEGVCADDCLPAGDVLDVLAALVDKSIVERVDGRGGAARYRMLQLIRDYGQERLDEAGELVASRRRHRDWYVWLAGRGLSEWISPRQIYWFTRLVREYPNVRAAVEFSLSRPGEAETVLSLVTSLPFLYWWSPGFAGEGLDWLSRALAQTTAPTGTRARALLLAAYVAGWLGAADIMRRHADEGERLARCLGDAATVALAGFVRGGGAFLRKDLATTIEVAQQALTVLSTLPEPEQRREETLRLQLLLQVGSAAADSGDHERARRCFELTWELAEARGAEVHQTWALWGLALVSWRQGRSGEAGERTRQCLRLARQTGAPDPYIAVLALEVLAWIAAGRRRHRHAAVLFGAAATMLADLGMPLTPVIRAEHDACERQARAALGEARFIDAFRRGRALRIDDAFALALDEPLRPAAPERDSAASLTRRERQIADIVAQGRSNREIATMLFVSRRTVESHVEHILGKLGFTSRTQIAVWTAERRRTG